MIDYRIQVNGHLDPSWSDWLGGAQINPQADGTSLIQGTLPDQTALIAVLRQLNDLCVTVISVDQTAQHAQ